MISYSVTHFTWPFRSDVQRCAAAGSAGIDTAIASADGRAMLVLTSFVMPVSVAIPGTQVLALPLS